MASTTTFILGGEHAAARSVVDGAAAARGYTGEQMPTGTIKLTRGKLSKTLLLGAMAGKDFHYAYLLDYGVDASGYLTATLHRELGSSALKGGAIGAGMATTEYQEFANAIGAAVSAAGVYVTHATT